MDTHTHTHTHTRVVCLQKVCCKSVTLQSYCFLMSQGSRMFHLVAPESHYTPTRARGVEKDQLGPHSTDFHGLSPEVTHRRSSLLIAHCVHHN